MFGFPFVRRDHRFLFFFFIIYRNHIYLKIVKITIYLYAQISWKQDHEREKCGKKASKRILVILSIVPSEKKKKKEEENKNLSKKEKEAEKKLGSRTGTRIENSFLSARNVKRDKNAEIFSSFIRVHARVFPLRRGGELIFDGGGSLRIHVDVNTAEVGR